MAGIKYAVVIAVAVVLAIASAGAAMAGQQTPYRMSDPQLRSDYALTGTYQLEATTGDDPQRAAERASRAAPPDQRQRTYRNLLARLESPETITIERSQYNVTMASTRGEQMSFEADGRDRTERWAGGRTINTRATLEGDRLVVATTGDRGSDFIVTFEPGEDGRSLLVTRTIYDEGLREPVIVRSYYRRTSDQAQWNMDGGNPQALYVAPPAAPDFFVPDGTRFVARLDHALSTTNAREGDRWTMTASSPSQYRGAVIQGYVSSVNASGRPSGSADMSLNLQSIRLRNGAMYEFDGVIESIRTPDGQMIRVDRGGSVESLDSQTHETVERGAVGAALGALIGAIAGGGKGAAIGAVVGAGVGAGTAVVEGRDRFDLQRGTQVTFTSGSPWNRRGVPGAQR
jgi:hypothetical protein